MSESAATATAPAPTAKERPELVVDAVSVSFGLHRVLDECSITVRPGEIVALMGHNGAGKTTLLRSVMGLVHPQAGRVTFGGQDLAGEPPATRAQHGLALVPDVSRGGVFSDLSVRDNLRLAEDIGRGAGAEISDDLLRELFPPIFEKADQPARELSGGQRQMVAIALALKRRPTMLLLDEPSVGLAPMIVQHVMSAIRRVTDETGIGALLVEQNVPAASRVADRLAVLKGGRVVREFAPDEVTDIHALWEYF